MGIDAERFVHSIPQDCFCIICDLVLEDPLEVILCGHHFCYKCYERWSLEQQKNNTKEIECPYCGTYSNKDGVRKSKLAWNLIQNFNIFCDNKKRGCESEFKLGFHDLHRCEHDKKMSEENDDDEVIEKCSLCHLPFLENHDCLKELKKISKHSAIQLTNLEHENSRLVSKFTKREKEFLENVTLMETQYQEENLKYNKEIRELKTRLVTIQGELGRKKGQSEVETIHVDLQRLNGTLGFNIIGGASENEKNSSGIFVSRITEGGAADKPGKLKLHDRIIEVDGVNLREASHAVAVKTFQNSGDPVKMVIQRQMYKNKSCEASTQTFGVIFAVTGDETRAAKNLSNQQDKFIKNNIKTKSCRWINPQEFINSINIKTDEDDDFLQNADQIIQKKEHEIKIKDENNFEEYDSAYDTLVTQKSSRDSRSVGSSDVEVSNSNSPNAVMDEDCESPKVVLRQNINKNSENRLSTFYVIPAEDTPNVNTDTLQADRNHDDSNEDFEEYEYEEVSLSKTADEKYGLLLCYGGDETDVAVYVGDLEENSVADLNSRIMVGDQIVRINGAHVSNVEEAYEMLRCNNTIKLVVARAVYETQTDFYDDAEETDLDMLDDVSEDVASDTRRFQTPTNDYLSLISSANNSHNVIREEDEETEDQIDDKKILNDPLAMSCSRDSSPLQRTKSLSPVHTAPPVRATALDQRVRSSSTTTDHCVNDKTIKPLSSAVANSKPEKESKYSFKNFVKQKLGNSSNDKKDKRPNSHSDDSAEIYKLPRCDSNSSNSGSARSKRSSSKENKPEHSLDVSKAKVKEQRQLSRMKAYLDSPSLIRHRIANNMVLKPTQTRGGNVMPICEQSPYMVNNNSTLMNPRETFNPQSMQIANAMRKHNPDRNSLSESVLRSAMKPVNIKKSKQTKHVQIDSHPNWNDTEKRVWEEFKIIQSMEAKENLNNKQQNTELNNVEAEWRVRRSKDGKHIYIKKTNSSRNRVLKDREEQIQEERCGMTTDDDAFTVYQGHYWNKDQRKRQLHRHNDRRKKLLQKAIAKETYENKTEKVLNEMAQRNMFLPVNTVFDNYITVEEILSQRNRSGMLDGPVHVTTI